MCVRVGSVDCGSAAFATRVLKNAINRIFLCHVVFLLYFSAVLLCWLSLLRRANVHLCVWHIAHPTTIFGNKTVETKYEHITRCWIFTFSVLFYRHKAKMSHRRHGGMSDESLELQ